MTTTAGFYKFEGDLLRYASSSVYAPNFTLLIEVQQTYTYPVSGWYYFATTEQAESFFEINGQSQAQWVEFGAAVQVNPAVNQLIAAALQQLPNLGLGLAVGLGKAEDGRPANFLKSWSIAKQLNLITPQLVTEVTALAQQFDLPADFVAALGPA